MKEKKMDEETKEEVLDCIEIMCVTLTDRDVFSVFKYVLRLFDKEQRENSKTIR